MKKEKNRPQDIKMLKMTLILLQLLYTYEQHICSPCFCPFSENADICLYMEDVYLCRGGNRVGLGRVNSGRG